MMKDIQEKRLENELALLQESIIPSKFRRLKNDEYYIDVMLPKEMVDSSGVVMDIGFLIHIVSNFPFNQPKVYCKTPFCFPHICDYRDILEDIIGQNWLTHMSLLDIVNKIPDFVKEFVKNLQEGILVLIGNYYLGDKYDLSLIEGLPLYFRKVKEKVLIDGKERELAKILVVSDIFFLLFEQEKWTKNNIHLTFWSNIRSLLTIKKVMKGDTCRFFWRQKSKKKPMEMVLTVDNSDNLVNLLLDKMSKFGINYKVSKNNLEPKQGVISPIDIETVEKTIEDLEKQVETNPDMELMQYLMSLYEKAVEYYSAANNPKYEYYTEKIHTTLKSPRINDFLESDRGGSVTKQVNKEDNKEKVNEELVDFKESIINESYPELASEKQKDGEEEIKKTNSEIKNENNEEEVKATDNETKIEETKTETKIGEIKIDENQNNETKIDEIKIDENQNDEIKIDETKIDENQNDEIKIDETKIVSGDKNEEIKKEKEETFTNNIEIENKGGIKMEIAHDEDNEDDISDEEEEAEEDEDNEN